MSWFAFGKKKKPTPEEAYKAKLDQLQKLGYPDRAKNLESLKLYAGDVNLVIQDYQIQQPSSKSISPKQEPKPQSKPVQPKPIPPKQESKPVQPKTESKPAPKQEQKQAPKQPIKPQKKPTQSIPKTEPKPGPKQEQTQPMQSKPVQPQPVQPKPIPPKQESKPVQPKTEAKPAPKQEQKQAPKQPKTDMKSEPKPVPKQEQTQPIQSKAKPTQPKTEVPSERKQSPKKEYKSAKMSEPKLIAKQLLPDIETPPKQSTKKQVQILNNLHGLPSSHIRQVLLNIGEPQIGEIIFSNGLDGDQFYHYIVVNPLLKKFNLSFPNHDSYSMLVSQVELSFQKNGAVDIYNRPPKDSVQKSEEKTENTAESESESKSNQALKQNIATLISSDVRLLLLPFNVELAERLYAFSLNGSDLCRFDYNGVCFATGMETLSKDVWNKIVTELCLPQSEPFDEAKWMQLKTKQENVIRNAKMVDKNIKKAIASVKEEKNADYTEQMSQLNRIVQIERECDTFLPQNLQKLKQKQMTTLTTLHDIASIINLDASIVDSINKSARKQSEIQLQTYLRAQGSVKLGNINIKSKSDTTEITANGLEQRQLQLLSTINATRNKLEKLAALKGVSMAELNMINSAVKDSENISFAALNDKFDKLFQNLSSIASEVQETARVYGAKLDNSEINKYIAPLYADLEIKQTELIARVQFLNDQARMINPKAVQVNEEILQISGNEHRRTLSGPSHLSVPVSPGDSPTPQDHFPDTGETKLEYEFLSGHPSSLKNVSIGGGRSRSPSSPGIVITSPDETQREANQVRQRRKSLQVNSIILRKTLMKCDQGKTGYLSKDVLIGALKGIGIEMDESDIGLLEDVCDGNGVNVKKMLRFVEEIHLTLQLKTCKQWNAFRMKVISVKNK